VSQLFVFADDVPDGPYADNHRRRKERDAAHMQQFRADRTPIRADRTPTGNRGPRGGAGPWLDPGPAEQQPPATQGAHALCHGGARRGEANHSRAAHDKFRKQGCWLRGHPMLCTELHKHKPLLAVCSGSGARRSVNRDPAGGQQQPAWITAIGHASRQSSRPAATAEGAASG